jgi:phosphatidylglycerophosphatase C
MRGVAAFDFDKTITTRDTLGPFMWQVGGLRRNVIGAASTMSLLTERDSSVRRNHVKARMFRRVFGGVGHDDIATEADQYARTLSRWFRPGTLEHIRRHRERGHELVLVTASLRVYAEPAALALGFDRIMAVELATDDAGRATGDLVGVNLRGPEKARRLREHLGDEPAELWAYGDSAGDVDMLAMANHPTWVGRPPRGQ